MYRLTKERLKKEIEYAFYLARKNKRQKEYVKTFEKSLSENIDKLTDALFNREYIPSPSFCFIIQEPKIREIFAAKFSDRIVHHLYYNMVAKMYESLLIEDSYSCREGKGTHYGVKRLYRHIRKASENYTKKVYVLQLDIKGYFINIDREILLEITEGIFEKMRHRHFPRKPKGVSYENVIDFDFVTYLNKVIVMNDPSRNCIMKSPDEAWISLPDSKSLFKSRKNCGLPIGNLTSQLLSNVYMNNLDQYIKRVLKCKHYGRYVDDLYIVEDNKERLKAIIPSIRDFLRDRLHLELNEGKTKITKASRGVQFLGYFVKEHRIYLCNRTLTRIINRINNEEISENSINSYIGMFQHCKSFRMRRKIFGIERLRKNGFYNDDYTKYIPYNRIKVTGR